MTYIIIRRKNTKETAFVASQQNFGYWPIVTDKYIVYQNHVWSADEYEVSLAQIGGE